MKVSRVGWNEESALYVGRKSSKDDGSASGRLGSALAIAERRWIEDMVPVMSYGRGEQ